MPYTPPEAEAMFVERLRVMSNEALIDAYHATVKAALEGGGTAYRRKATAAAAMSQRFGSNDYLVRYRQRYPVRPITLRPKPALR